MKYPLTATAIVLLSCAVGCTSTTAEKRDTYTMQKSGMSSGPHEMQTPPATDEPAKKPGTTRMPKGVMRTGEHEMPQ
ncbi:MAG: hypothetical protein U0871_15500 [Gemmataceae bacterium]